MNAAAAFFLLVSTTLSLALTDDQNNSAENIKKKCLAESGIKAKDWEKGRESEFVDPVLQKFVYCFLKSSDLIDEDSVPKPDVIKAKLGSFVSPTKIEDALNACKNITGENKEAKASAFYKCYHKHTD